MGKFTTTTEDRADYHRAGEFAANGSGPWIDVEGRTNLFVHGAFVADLTIERSFDAGVTAIPVTGADGAVRVITAAEGLVLDEPERGMKYRLVCANRQSGTIKWRFSR